MSLYDLDDELQQLWKVKTDIFGPGQLLRVKSSSDDDKGPQFASELNFLVVEMQNDDESIRKVPIVVKKQAADDAREKFNTDVQFANEVNMYNTIMPRLGVFNLNLVPRHFYGHATSGKRPNEDIMILEDLRELGFQIPEDIFLNFDHVSKALRKLGQFHGLSYNFKKTAPDDFATFGPLLKIHQRKMLESEEIQFQTSLASGFVELLKRRPDDVLVRRVYDQLVKRGFVEEWNRLKMPREPFAVVIHGDFNRNNLFYQYDKNGTVTDIKFLDFGTSLMGDPSVDIAFFLNMNVDQETRNKHWDEFLTIYWSGLTSIAPEPGFTFDEFLNHFQKRAISGYFPCSFFLPAMLNNFVDKTVEDQNDWPRIQSPSSEKGVEAVINILIHARDRGFMLAFLEDQE